MDFAFRPGRRNGSAERHMPGSPFEEARKLERRHRCGVSVLLACAITCGGGLLIDTGQAGASANPVARSAALRPKESGPRSSQILHLGPG